MTTSVFQTSAQPAGAEFDVEPYRGDDWAQSLARTMWLPMLAMGLMAVLTGLVLGAWAGPLIGDFFQEGTPAADDFGRAQAIGAVGSGITFAGMGFILSGIAMLLVNIVRTLRDAGRDVQESFGASEVLKLRKPWEGKLLPYVMMAGDMILLAGVVLGVVVAVKLGSIPPAVLAAAGTGALRGDNLTKFGVAQAILAWVGPLRLVGIATVFGSIVLALRVIIRTLRFQSFRLVELAREVQVRRETTEGPSITSRPQTRRTLRAKVS